MNPVWLIVAVGALVLGVLQSMQDKGDDTDEAKKAAEIKKKKAAAAAMKKAGEAATKKAEDDRLAKVEQDATDAAALVEAEENAATLAEAQAIIDKKAAEDAESASD